MLGGGWRRQRVRRRKQQLRWSSVKVVAHHPHPSESVLWLLPGAVTVRSQGDSADRILRSATHSVSRPNYYLPTLTELEGEALDDLFASSEVLEDYHLCPSPGLGPELESPLPRRLRSYREASNTSPTVNYYS